jgi:hypothetical protein
MTYKFTDYGIDYNQSLEFQQNGEDGILITAIENESISLQNYIIFNFNTDDLKDLIDALNSIYSKLNTNKDG